VRRIPAAGGVVYRVGPEETEILLIFRRGVWDLPKGKVDPGERVETCALREVSEEAGVPTPQLQDHLVTTYHRYVEDEEPVEKETHWYAMKLPPECDPQLVPEQAEGIEKAEWVPLPEAQKRVGYENLSRVLTAFHRYFKETKKA